MVFIFKILVPKFLLLMCSYWFWYIDLTHETLLNLLINSNDVFVDSVGTFTYPIISLA